MVRLYDYWRSGNCYKVRLLLSQLGEPFERVHLDLLKGETRTPEFLAKNPNRRVPLVEWPDGRRLAESDAIWLGVVAPGPNPLVACAASPAVRRGSSPTRCHSLFSSLWK